MSVGGSILTTEGLNTFVETGASIVPKYFKFSADTVTLDAALTDSDFSSWLQMDITLYQTINDNTIEFVCDVLPDAAIDFTNTCGLYLEDGTLFMVATPPNAFPAGLRQTFRIQLSYENAAGMMDFQYIDLDNTNIHFQDIESTIQLLDDSTTARMDAIEDLHETDSVESKARLLALENVDTNVDTRIDDLESQYGINKTATDLSISTINGQLAQEIQSTDGEQVIQDNRITVNEVSIGAVEAKSTLDRTELEAMINDVVTNTDTSALQALIQDNTDDIEANDLALSTLVQDNTTLIGTTRTDLLTVIGTNAGISDNADTALGVRIDNLDQSTTLSINGLESDITNIDALIVQNKSDLEAGIQDNTDAIAALGNTDTSAIQDQLDLLEDTVSSNNNIITSALSASDDASDIWNNTQDDAIALNTTFRTDDFQLSQDTQDQALVDTVDAQALVNTSDDNRLDAVEGQLAGVPTAAELSSLIDSVDEVIQLVDDIETGVVPVEKANTWTTARTLTLAGDATGSVSIDGSQNVTLTTNIQNDSHTHAFGNITSKPSTVFGYGITDAVQEGDTVALTGDVTGTAAFDANGNISMVTTVGNDSHLHAFSAITSKPTTIAGYGITDGVQEGDTVTLNGDVTGTANFDANGDISLTTTVGNNSHTHTFSNITSRPSTIAGYGITDAILISDIQDVLTSIDTNKPLSANQGKILKGYIDNLNTLVASDDTTLDTIQEIVDFISLNKDTLDALSISSISGLQTALNTKLAILDFTFANLGGKPSTIAGYGITDGVQEGDTVTLTGEVTGTANFDTNGNISLATTVQVEALPAGGTTGQLLTNTTPGVGTWQDAPISYVHPSYNGNDINLDSTALTGATVISDLDFHVTTDTEGHVSSAGGTLVTRTLTAADLGASVDTHTHSSSPADFTVGAILKTDFMETKTGNPLSINAGESRGKVPSQTAENIYLNAEGGLSVNTPDRLHTNWEAGYTVDTTIIRGDAIFINGNEVMHDGNYTAYVHPTYVGDDFSIDTGALTGAVVISDIDINVTTDTLGHITDTNATVATRTITAANVGAVPSTGGTFTSDVNFDTGINLGPNQEATIEYNAVDNSIDFIIN